MSNNLGSKLHNQPLEIDNPLSLQLRKLQETEVLPMSLLLLADETTIAIETYIYDSEIYEVHVDGNPQPIAACALYRLNEGAMEIKNIAVAEVYQNRGVGSWLLAEIKILVKASGYSQLWVGTADAGYRQQQFYLRNGFEQKAVRKDFFIQHYPEPIYENGQQLKDMTMFEVVL